MSAERLTVVFFPEAAYGPTNNCVGIGRVLRERGHRVVFAAEASYEGTLEKYGFEEATVHLAEPAETEEDPGQFWKDFIRETAPEFRKPTIEQLDTFIKPVWEALIDGARYVEDTLSGVLDDVGADVVVEDNVLCFPATVTAGVPWVRITSCNPLELKDPAIPPVFSGCPAADRSGWDEFVAEYRRTHGEIWGSFNEWCVSQGTDPLPDLEFIHQSPWLNMYLYPEAADYQRRNPLDPTWHRLESSVRTTDDSFELPAELEGDGSLVYLSLGSLGSADVALMQHLVEVLADTPHRFIVSKGPQHSEYELADNMWGAEFLPQTNILPLVDLVITHGGNNTITEAFHFGKPMVVLPLFWDQYDNAQRVDELGFGVRLPTYTFEPDQMTGALDRLLADDDLTRRLGEVSSRLKADPGTQKAADLIERLGRTRQPVHR